MRTVRKVGYVICALAALLLVGGLVTACGGSSDSGDSSAASAPKQAASAAPGNNEADTGNAAGGSGSGSRGSGGAGSAASQAKLDPNPAGRAVIYQSDLRVRAKNVDTATARAKQLVTAAGGYVDNESSTSDPVGASVTFKIPADRYPAVLDQLSGQLGTKLSLRQQAEDVTGEVADVDSRVRSAQATLDSFRKLLDRARTVGEVMNVEQEISQRQADLEALQARQKSLQQRTRFATVTLAIEPNGKPSPAHHGKRRGFMGGLENGWHAFTTFVGGLLLVFGWLLPFLIPLALIGLPALAIWHRIRDRRTDAPGAPPAQPDRPVAGVGAGPGPRSGSGSGSDQE
ncbi:DUF4349 domain-containing protein [Actinomadura barringtoniae]|uniref:DUF4349 domain-containing protein n=1 Tax=Actinomadura barringtoniae TaxID=1427535 RepID=A0A939P9K3_9ACTN|nr:DUF4349 domain-containing protein [Actinomadura barringtoniae]MBO2448526.1 DUF4349 domain-containing protein [Actinomadura barringtoniae]